MSTDVGVMEIVDLAIDFTIDIPCEHAHHQGGHNRHHGNAEWIQSTGDCYCPPGHTAFMCAKWRNWVSDLAMRNGNLYCTLCKTSFPAASLTYTKI